VSGAAFLPEAGLALLRLEDFAPSVAYRAGRLAQDLSPHGEVRVLEAAESRDLWRRIRDAEPLAAAAEEAIWRVSVRPSAGPEVLAAATAAGMRGFLDWGGGLVWLAGPATLEAHAVVMRAAAAAGGNFILFRAPEPLRLAVPVLPEEPPPLAALSRRVKAALDPAGILNPGRMRAGL
jgi:glycolate oxidase FAD binding subunit